ncbi:hypothetical protein F5146DRAFT_1229000 [Armillaria mellea]|nr:hypothetical protein F5146DRAFT_1229000 [Armillaria mellea]
MHRRYAALLSAPCPELTRGRRTPLPTTRINFRSRGLSWTISIQTAMRATPPIFHSFQTPRHLPITAPPYFLATRRTSHSLPHTCPLNPSYPHSDTVIVTATPQPIVELTVPQIEARSHIEVENSYGVQYQDDDFSVNVQDSRERFRRDYAYSAATDDWAVQLN